MNEKNRDLTDHSLIFELSSPGRTAYSLPEMDVPVLAVSELIPEAFLRKQEAALPEVYEVDIIRHYTGLSRRNFGVDNGFYPLGSCTMKYNPKINEDVARYAGFAKIHPYQPEESIQGALQLMYTLQQDLAGLTGMDAVTLQPAAGAHGEWTGLMMIRAYHESHGELKRTKVIVPDSSHGTNPASASVAGFQTVTIPSKANGLVDLDTLRASVGEDTAALMLTNPNTLGLFEEQIQEIAAIVHEAGGLLYYDGANSNAIMGITRPGDMGFDVVHLNLHKTMSTPHGGGGPGAGPVGVKQLLVPFLPPLVIKQEDGTFAFSKPEGSSIGRVKAYYGNFGILVRAYAYIRTYGPEGLRRVSEYAVLNANYMRVKLAPYYEMPYERICKHEFVMSGSGLKPYGIHTLDVAKRLLDFGFHPPTIYFPLNVEECIMLEPTETESKETLDRFIDVMIQIADEAKNNPELLLNAPHSTPVTRLDETAAARRPVLNCSCS